MAPSSNSARQDLADTTSIVTGGGAGIGRAIALELGTQGSEILVVGRDMAKLERTRSLVLANGGRCRALALDLTQRGFEDELACEAPDADVLVHSAMHFAHYGALEDVPADEVERSHTVTVLAPMRICATYLPGMKARGFGRIVFIGSVAATAGTQRQAAYSSAKSALHGLARSLALEGAAHGVTCNVVEPGIVLTERVLRAIPESTRAALIANTPMKRPGEPEEIAALVGFLASRRASYVTGAIIPVAGGLGLGLFRDDLRP